MWKCEKCGGQVNYDGKVHAFRCVACEDTNVAEPVQSGCPACGHPYTKYTWFDPVGCVACRKSFVD